MSAANPARSAVAADGPDSLRTACAAHPAPRHSTPFCAITRAYQRALALGIRRSVG